ncbi:MAG: phosphate-starvation-inducible PsiE family protein [Gloeomargarita sp. HHBFW_bins_205]
MKRWRFRDFWGETGFLGFIASVEGGVARLLSLAMVGVIVIALIDLLRLLVLELASEPKGFFGENLFTIFGAFLNVLIALEILENITAYLRRHAFQVELVIVTSLIAVARKIIILDLEKTTGLGLVGLAAAVLALSVSYWIIHRSQAPHER